MLEIKRTENYRIFLIKDLSKLPIHFQLAIQSVKSTEKGFEVKMYSKIDALDRCSSKTRSKAGGRNSLCNTGY